MRFFSSDGEPAIISVGQAANGIFALGQVAHGIVAVGQLAVGVVVLGQASFSILGVGQVGAGVTWFTGLGVGGRGFCLRLIPGLDPPRVPPDVVPFDSLLAAGQGTEGFVRAEVIATPRGARLALGGAVLPVKLTPQIAWALDSALSENKVREVFAHVRRVTPTTLVCDRAIEIPGARPGFPVWLQIARVVLLVALATGWWFIFDASNAIKPD